MVLLFALPAALAAGYHLGEVEAIYGLAEPGVPGARLPVEAGFGLSMLSDDFAYTMTFGDPDLAGNGHGHKVKEWGFARCRYGMPLAGTDNPFDDEAPRADRSWLLQDSWGHFGGDATTRRALDWHSSSHLGLSIPGFFGVPSRVAHLGPTAGFGLDLTWWDRWEGHAEDTVLTGKVLGEAGLVSLVDLLVGVGEGRVRDLQLLGHGTILICLWRERRAAPRESTPPLSLLGRSAGGAKPLEREVIEVGGKPRRPLDRLQDRCRPGGVELLLGPAAAAVQVPVFRRLL
jgi:hypothetical protein